MRCLDHTLRTLTGYRLQRTTSTAMAEFNRVFAVHGLRRTTFAALTLIVETPGMRQSQLAEALAIERPNIVQIVVELEQAGLVERKTAKDDRRAYALQPTATGRRVFERALAQVQPVDRAITAGLTPDQVAALHKALDRIEWNVRATGAADDFEVPRP